jgi:hypothetical protein
MHDPHHEIPDVQQATSTTPAPDSTASWRFGHSPAGGAPEPDPAPGEAATEGVSQPGQTGCTRRTNNKGKARPREKKQRSAQSVRLSDQEHTIIQGGADAVGMSLAGFLAHSGLAAARDQSRTAVTIATERDVLTELFAMRRQLGWAGSNLNQVAKVLNSGSDVPYLKEVLADIHGAANAVKKAVDWVANRQEGEAA